MTQSRPKLIGLILILLTVRLMAYALVTGHLEQLPDTLCVWDCDWFVQTAGRGYDHVVSMNPGTFLQANWVDFPVFPQLMKFVAFSLHVSLDLAGMLISNIFMAAFVYFAVLYMEIVAPSISTAALVVFLFAFPNGFYLSLAYTEGAYAAFTMAAFYFLARQSYLLSSMAAGLLSGTRVTGVLFTPIVVVRRLFVMRTAYLSGGPRAAGQAAIASILPVALAPLGLFLFMTFLYFYIGDAFAFMHIQKSWGRVEQNPFLVIFNGLHRLDFLNADWKVTYSASFASACAVVGLLLSLRLLIIKRYAECWSLASLILIACSAGLIAFPRYCLANPIFLISLFEVFWLPRLRPFFIAVIILFFGLQLFLIHLWAQHYAFLL